MATWCVQNGTDCFADKLTDPVDVHCEVRYCLPSVGVGLELMDITTQDEKANTTELEPPARKRNRLK